jgi:hypothetical protein
MTPFLGAIAAAVGGGGGGGGVVGFLVSTNEIECV